MEASGGCRVPQAKQYRKRNRPPLHTKTCDHVERWMLPSFLPAESPEQNMPLTPNPSIQAKSKREASPCAHAQPHGGAIPTRLAHTQLGETIHNHGLSVVTERGLWAYNAQLWRQRTSSVPKMPPGSKFTPSYNQAIGG